MGRKVDRSRKEVGKMRDGKWNCGGADGSKLCARFFIFILPYFKNFGIVLAYLVSHLATIRFFGFQSKMFNKKSAHTLKQ